MRDDETQGLRYAKQALQHPVHALIRIASHVLYRPWLRYVLGVRAGPGLRVLGFPLVDLRSGAALEIGENVTLNSSNYGYHVNMHSPVKLFAEGPRARIRIGSNTRIHGACLHAYEAVEVGSGCLIAANTQIFDGSGHDLSFPNVADRIHTKGESAPVRIGDNVWIGADCLVLPGVSIGHGSVVAAGSVVVSDVPALAVVAGNPARVLKELGSE